MSKNSNSETSKKFNSTQWKQFLKFLGISLFFLFIIVMILSSHTPPWLSWLDLSKSGAVGDTIGGITNPIIGLIGSYLVYISFLKQSEANQLQKDALDEEREARKQEQNLGSIMSSFNYLRHEVDTFKVKHGKGSEQVVFGGLEGLMAFSSITKDIGHFPEHVSILSNTMNLSNIVAICSYLMKRIEEVPKDNSEKIELTILFGLFYRTKIAPSLIQIKNNTKHNPFFKELASKIKIVSDQFDRFAHDLDIAASDFSAANK